MPPLPLVCKAVFASTLTGSTVHLEQILQQRGLVERTPDLQLVAKALLLSAEERAASGQLRPQAAAALPGAAGLEPAEALGSAAEARQLGRLAAELPSALQRAPARGLAEACLCASLLLVATAACVGVVVPQALATPAKALRAVLRGTQPPPAPVRALLAASRSAPCAPPGPASHLPSVCPALAHAAAGARLLVPMAPRDAVLWSAEVPVGALCPGSLPEREAPCQAPQLAVAVRWAESAGRLARAVEVFEQGPGGSIFASVSSSLEVRLMDGAVYGRLRLLGGRRYVLEALEPEGRRPVMCLSADPEVTAIELGALPEGILLATVSRHPGKRQGQGGAAAAGAGVVGGRHFPGVAAADVLDVEHLEVLAKPGVDALFVLVCTMAVVLFAQHAAPLAPAPPPAREPPRPEPPGRAAAP